MLNTKSIGIFLIEGYVKDQKCYGFELDRVSLKICLQGQKPKYTSARHI